MGKNIQATTIQQKFVSGIDNISFTPQWYCNPLFHNQINRHMSLTRFHKLLLHKHWSTNRASQEVKASTFFILIWFFPNIMGSFDALSLTFPGTWKVLFIFWMSHLIIVYQYLVFLCCKISWVVYQKMWLPSFLPDQLFNGIQLHLRILMKIQRWLHLCDFFFYFSTITFYCVIQI